MKLKLLTLVAMANALLGCGGDLSSGDAQTDTAAPGNAAHQAAVSPEQQLRAEDATVERKIVRYRVLSPAEARNPAPGLIEVAEVFMYGCPGCYNFEPQLRAWKEGKADYVQFVRIPAVWDALSELHARAYYTAEELGKADEMHEAFFNEIHVNRNLLDTPTALRALFGRFGVDAQTFDGVFESPAVSSKLRRAEDLIRRYRVASTPAIVVNGKYVLDTETSGGYTGWFEVIDELARTESAAGA